MVNMEQLRGLSVIGCPCEKRTGSAQMGSEVLGVIRAVPRLATTLLATGTESDGQSQSGQTND